MKIIVRIVVASSILMGTVHAGPPAGDSCMWTTIPNGPCILDEFGPGRFSSMK